MSQRPQQQASGEVGLPAMEGGGVSVNDSDIAGSVKTMSLLPSVFQVRPFWLVQD